MIIKPWHEERKPWYNYDLWYWWWNDSDDDRKGDEGVEFHDLDDGHDGDIHVW